MAVARFIDHWAFQVKEGKFRDLMAWVEKSEARMAEVFPAGGRWLGLYVDVIAGDSPGLVHVFIGVDSYGALDVASAAVADTTSEFSRLWTELDSFADQRNSARSGRWLSRAVSDVVYFGE